MNINLKEVLLAVEGGPGVDVSAPGWEIDPDKFDAVIKSLRDDNPDWQVDDFQGEIGQDIRPEEIQESLGRIREREEENERNQQVDQRLEEVVASNESHIWWQRMNPAEQILELQNQLRGGFPDNQILAAFQRRQARLDQERARQERQQPANFAAALTAANAEIADIEHRVGRDLSSEEREIIKARHFGKQMSEIDRRTADLYKNFEEIGFTNDTKLQRGLRTAGRILAGVGLGVATRSIIKLISPTRWGGMWAGGIAGAVWGGIRGAAAEKSKQLGTKGYVKEYSQIKYDSQLPEAERERAAIAFLEEVLSPASRKENVFKGNHSDLLNLLAYYRNELAQLYIKEVQSQEGGIGKVVKAEGSNVRSYEEAQMAIMENVGGMRLKIDEGQIEDFFEQLTNRNAAAKTLVAAYRDSRAVKRAINSAGMKGALRGAAIGAGFGFVADVIQHCFAAPEVERAAKAAHDKYVASHIGAEWNPVNQTGSANLPTHLNYEGYGLSSDPTHFGNYLSQTVKSGLEHGQLHLPPGVSNSDQLNYYLNYVKAPQGWGSIPVNPQGMDNAFHFNQYGLQHYLDHLRIGADGVVDPTRLTDTNFLSEAVADVPNQLSQRAAEAGAEAAGRALHDAGQDWLIYGAITGKGVALGGESAGKRTEAEVGLGDVRVKKEPPERLRVNPAGQAPAGAGGETPPGAPQVVEWNNMPDDDLFASQANIILGQLAENGWDNLSPGVQADLSAMFAELSKRTAEKSVKVSIGGSTVGDFQFFVELGSDKLLVVKKPQGSTTPGGAFNLNDKASINDLKISISNRPQGGGGRGRQPGPRRGRR